MDRVPSAVTTRSLPGPFAPRAAFALLLAAGVAILGTALASQYWGGLRPCELCLWQRYPYALMIGVAGIGLGLARVPGMPHTALRLLLAGAALLMLAGGGIAVFHVGVENGWWRGLAACTGAPGVMGGGAGTVEELAHQLQATPVVRCDAVAWSFAGISMAGYNAMASILIAAFAARAAWSAKGTTRTSR